MLNGSPRINGNTAFLLKTLAKEIDRLGHQSKYIQISEHDIGDCNGCLICEDTDCTGYCVINDDMQKFVLPELLLADVLVIGSPAYFDLPTGQLKRFMDRSNAALSRIQKRHCKYGIVVVGQSEPESLNTTFKAIKNYCRICGMKAAVKKPICIIARDEGDVEKNEMAKKSIRTLANQLVKAK
jgi:multimeric flavodoxin WrbA